MFNSGIEIICNVTRSDSGAVGENRKRRSARKQRADKRADLSGRNRSYFHMRERIMTLVNIINKVSP